jgi:elongation of very long chain fatty acids protein 6
VTVCLYVWWVVGNFDPASRPFGVINAAIHTIMYSYYAAKAMGLKLPRGLAKGITSLQIAQMVVGVGVNVITGYVKG